MEESKNLVNSESPILTRSFLVGAVINDFTRRVEGGSKIDIHDVVAVRVADDFPFISIKIYNAWASSPATQPSKNRHYNQ